MFAAIFFRYTSCPVSSALVCAQMACRSFGFVPLACDHVTTLSLHCSMLKSCGGRSRAMFCVSSFA